MGEGQAGIGAVNDGKDEREMEAGVLGAEVNTGNLRESQSRGMFK